MNMLLEINPNEPLSFFDTLTFGGQTVLIGMATIFAVLIIIWLSLIVFKTLFSISSTKEAKYVPEPEIVAAPAQVVASSNDDIVAVIAAAIAMAEAESDGAKFRVVSFKRK